MATKFYKSGDYYYIGNELFPTKKCTILFSADDSGAEIRILDTRAAVIQMQSIQEYTDEAGTPYIDKAALLTATGEFFSAIEIPSSSPQNPLPVSFSPLTYAANVRNFETDGNWSGDLFTLFSGSEGDAIQNTNSVNPKYIKINLKQPTPSNMIGLFSPIGTFSNVKVIIYLAGVAQVVYDESTDATPLNVLEVPLPDDIGYDAVKFEFLTSGNVELKAVSLTTNIFTSSIIRGVKPNGDYVNFNATQKGNFKVALEEYQGDAFGRLRVSNPFTIFDNSLNNQKYPLFWSSLLNGSGSISHDESKAKFTLKVGAVNGDYAISQTKMRFHYQSGKSHEALITGLFNTETDVLKRVGLFDVDNYNAPVITTTPQNGIAFVNDSGDLYFEIWNNGVKIESVLQENWNIDDLTGKNGGFLLDIESTNILFIDLEWLGVGSVRCGFVSDRGEIVVAHQFRHVSNGFTDVYMQNAKLPVNYTLLSRGGSGTMSQICSSIISEGGHNPAGLLYSTVASDNVAIGNNDIEVLAGIRLKENSFNSTVKIISASIMSASGANARWIVCLNPIYTGSVTWTDVDNMGIQESINNNNEVTDEGHVIMSGFISNNIDMMYSEIENSLYIGKDLAGNYDEIWLCVQSYGSESYRGSLNIREL